MEKVEQARARFSRGDYLGTIEVLQDDRTVSREECELLFSQALLAVGRYAEAYKAITNALDWDGRSLRLRWQAREVCLRQGKTREAGELLDDIIRRVSNMPRTYRDAESMVVFGQAVLLKGADPKRVLSNLFEAAKKDSPRLKVIYLASGTLALDKHDYQLAARHFEEGLKQIKDDPDLNVGLAQAYAPSDRTLMMACLRAALDRNTNHVGALLLLVDHEIDEEDFQTADELITRILHINPQEPDAWSYRAVIAELKADAVARNEARSNGLKAWPTNPRVDHLIGKKLSQNYRFAEGADHQKQALRFDPGYLPAQAQLAQDLLRLGEDAEGWRLAAEVHNRDEYDVEAYNLVTLQDKLKRFVVLTNDSFIVRMSTNEAPVYGARVMSLLNRAKATLSSKYGLQLTRPITIEIFPDQRDFAVRTFGMPGNPGYLGVCFGPLVTANSPAAHAAHPVNWEAVLWHEFCHVITLHLTKNKMPRWLSEGISVYEELQANPAWGQRMNPQYREMILDGELAPVSELSGAFVAPKTPLHLQFAYYQSYLVVDYLVSTFGFESLKGILEDVGKGVLVNTAIANRTTSMKALEDQFAAFARKRAELLAPGLDWEQPPWDDRDQKREPAAVANWEEWSKVKTNNWWALNHRAEELVQRKQWSEAKPLLKQLVDAYPDFVGEDSPYRLLAQAHRALGDKAAEKETLTRFADRDVQAGDAFLRLMELGREESNWAMVATNANRYLALNPLTVRPYEFLAEAGLALGKPEWAIEGYQATLQLGPLDPASVHFKLGTVFDKVGDKVQARRHVLQALEEAPRYREALDLLLQLSSPPAQASRTGLGVGVDR